MTSVVFDPICSRRESKFSRSAIIRSNLFSSESSAALETDLDLPPNIIFESAEVFETPKEELLDHEQLLRWDKSEKNLPVLSFQEPDIESDDLPTVTLDNSIFGVPIRRDIVHNVVVWQRANWRKGTSVAKKRNEKRGGGRKPWRQKGTGRARHGSIRSPIWRGGGKAHGPVLRSFKFKLNKKVRMMGLRVALASKWREGNLFIVDNAQLANYKTGALDKLIDKHGFDYAMLIDGEQLDENLEVASGNLPHFNAFNCLHANVYAILKHKQLVITLDGLKGLQTRLQNRIGPR